MQLSYQMNMNPAIAGGRYDNSPVTIDSLLAEGTIGLGNGLIAGTNPQTQAKVPAATFTAGFKGVALLQAKEQNDDGTVTYTAKDIVPVMRKGRAWVPFASGQAIVAETAAYLIFSGADAGKWTNAAGAGSVAVAVTGAKFITSNSSTTGGIVAVELS
jgi:hypothetical protein